MIQLIAEIGWNHCGDMELAKKMIKAASKSKATYAKFQTWSVNRLKPGEWDTDGRREIYEKAELSKKNHIEIIKCCEENNIKFLSSVFSIPDAQLLIELGCNVVKIPSFESRNIELIQFCDKNFDIVFMSTGTSTIDEIKESSIHFKKTDWFLMHCVSTYPCDYNMANLPKMFELQKTHGIDKVGYSDHIQGIESAKIAIAYGAKVIEKHFTIDNTLPGRDNKFATLPNELLDLSNYISYIDQMLISWGNGYQDGEKNSREHYAGRFNG